MSLKKQFFKEGYNIAIREGSEGGIFTNNTNFHVLKNDIFSWVADPFVFVHNGICYIFAERLKYRINRGVIAYTVYDPRTNSTNGWHDVIIEDYHLSFPNVFQNNGQIYIMPESSDGNTLCLYEAQDFPRSWKKIELMSNVKVVDSAFFDEKHGYTLELLKNGKTRARIFRLEDFKAEFCSGGVCSDTRVSRLGGKFFLYDGVLLKTSQNCRDSYGKELVFRSFNFSCGTTEEEDYRIITVDDIHLDKKITNLNGIHTYNYYGGYEVIDLKSKRFAFFEFVNSIKRKLFR